MATYYRQPEHDEKEESKPRLLTGIDWTNNLHLRPMPQKETRNLTVTVDGDERDATWKQGVGIYVDGHDFGKGDMVLIDWTPHQVVEMQQMMIESEAVTLIGKLRTGVWKKPR